MNAAMPGKGEKHSQIIPIPAIIPIDIPLMSIIIASHRPLSFGCRIATAAYC
jgi:hypothetical protein